MSNGCYYDGSDMTDDTTHRITRRQALIGGAGAAGLLALGGYELFKPGNDGAHGGATFAGASGTADVTLHAKEGSVDLGSRTVKTWSYDDTLPGREVRVRQGDHVRVRVVNDLPADTSIHWHGVRLDNAMDGVPGATQKPIAPGESFVYDFVAPDAGTYMYHSHVGVQLDRGLYGPLIVEARDETLAYDGEATLMLDDWLDGVAGTPDQQLRKLQESGMSMGGSGGMSMGGMHMGGSGGMSMGSSDSDGARLSGPIAGRFMMLDGMHGRVSDLSGLANGMAAGMMDVGDVRHPYHVVNGRTAGAPFVVRAKRGAMLRLRLANIASDTVYAVFVDGRPVTIVATDGQRVEPVRSDGVVIGAGERYDVLVRMGDAPTRIVAVPLGKKGRAVALLRPDGSTSKTPPAGAPVTMPRRIASYADLKSIPATPAGKPDVEHRLDLGFKMPYTWTLGGTTDAKGEDIRIERGQKVRFAMRNETMMPHPMHLHGHSFRPVLDGGAGPLKDTILVAPHQEVAIDFLADNPGTWMFHCHNIYHAAAGMMRTVVVA